MHLSFSRFSLVFFSFNKFTEIYYIEYVIKNGKNCRRFLSTNCIKYLQLVLLDKETNVTILPYTIWLCKLSVSASATFFFNNIKQKTQVLKIIQELCLVKSESVSDYT